MIGVVSAAILLALVGLIAVSVVLKKRREARFLKIFTGQGEKNRDFLAAQIPKEPVGLPTRKLTTEELANQEWHNRARGR